MANEYPFCPDEVAAAGTEAAKTISAAVVPEPLYMSNSQVP